MDEIKVEHCTCKDLKLMIQVYSLLQYYQKMRLRDRRVNIAHPCANRAYTAP